MLWKAAFCNFSPYVVQREQLGGKVRERSRGRFPVSLTSTPGARCAIKGCNSGIRRCGCNTPSHPLPRHLMGLVGQEVTITHLCVQGQVPSVERVQSRHRPCHVGTDDLLRVFCLTSRCTRWFGIKTVHMGLTEVSLPLVPDM